MTLSNRLGQRWGWVPQGNPGTVTVQTNAAANWYALAFVPDAGRTLSAVRTFVSAVAGTLAGTDITCDLYDSTGTSGAPGSAIESGKVPSATITAAGWYDWTGFTTALTAGQTYWLVFKNVNAVQATNNNTFRAVTNITGSELIGINNRLFWGESSSTNSGSTWSTGFARSALRLAYADGTYDGFPFSTAASAGSGDGVYSARESGIKFTSPSNAVLKVAGLALFIAGKTGSPTGNPRLGLWTGTTPALLSYTALLPTTALTTAQWAFAYFASVQTIQPGTVCRVTLGESTQSDAVGNRYNLSEVTCDTDSNSLALLPGNGTCVKTYFDGSSTWTDTSGSLFGFALLPDTSGEYGGYAYGSRQFLGF